MRTGRRPPRSPARGWMLRSMIWATRHCRRCVLRSRSAAPPGHSTSWRELASVWHDRSTLGPPLEALSLDLHVADRQPPDPPAEYEQRPALEVQPERYSRAARGRGDFVARDGREAAAASRHGHGQAKFEGSHY